jgi:error-prone DNA polymerase
MTCLRHHTTLKDAGRRLIRNAEMHLKNERDMLLLFPEHRAAVQRTSELAGRLQFTLTNLGYEFPRYPVPPGETMNSFLRQITDAGARRRYQPYHDKARTQIERELAVIEKLNLAGYFLIVWDIVEFCRSKRMLAQGRGSAANSAVCYALGITAVDPVGMELLFERFLNEERHEWPDIDIDLPSGDQRESVIQYVYQRYGQFGAAMTANVITYRGRSATREIAKVLGLDDTCRDQLLRYCQSFGWHEAPEDIDLERLKEVGLDPEDRRLKMFFGLYKQMLEQPRHLGQHSGGMVICQGQLDSVVPLEPASMPGRVVVQWDKEDCADLGIIKVDLLGLGMLAAVQDTLDFVNTEYHQPLEIYQLPPNDPKVYAALQKADTVGWFQVESRAQMSSLPRTKPEKFYDLVVQVAIIRPGPIAGKMMHPYVRRRQGKEPPESLHPVLEPILRRTLGVPLFQEQLLRIAMVAAGFTGGEAEELRRAMGFLRSDRKMKALESRLRDGMARNGVTGPAQEKIVKAITSFALYGFPESHAASFALIAYASGYLKCHYPAAFLAALLNNQPMGFYHAETLVKDAQRHGVRVRPIDIQLSDWRCKLEHPTFNPAHQRGEPEAANTPEPQVRLGFCYLKGFSQKAGEAIMAARPFTSIDDLYRRVPQLRAYELLSLAEVGALNTLLPKGHRRDALWEARRVIRPVGPLFESLEEQQPTPSPLKAMRPEERLRADFLNMSLSVGPHPMTYYRQAFPEDTMLRAMDLKYLKDGQRVEVGGCVICRQRPETAKGLLFLSLEDETGIANLVVYPDFQQGQNRQTLLRESYLRAGGVLQNQDGVVSVRVDQVEGLRFTNVHAPSHDFR